MGEYQAGFRKNRSTIDQIFTLRQIFEKNWEFGKEVHNLFIDFKKACDSIHRNSLWNILKEFGILCKLINLVKICMENTKNIVLCSVQTSKPFCVSTGLKQGDALSPVLFNFALEKIIRIVKETTAPEKFTRFLGYADDINLVGNSEDAIKATFRNTRETAEKLGLKVNQEKTEYLLLKRITSNSHDLQIDDINFKQVESFKYLGCIFNNNNKMKEEIQARIQVGNKNSPKTDDIKVLIAQTQGNHIQDYDYANSLIWFRNVEHNNSRRIKYLIL